MRWIVLLLATLAACTAADLANITTLGSAGDITCYSGGQVIFTGRSTGKIATEQQSDGWRFVDAASGKLIRVSGDCVIRN